MLNSAGDRRAWLVVGAPVPRIFAALVGGGPAEDDAAEGVAGQRFVAQVGEAEGDAVGVADAEMFAVGLELDVPVVRVDAAAVEDDEIFVMVDVGDGADPLDDRAAEVPLEARLRESHAVHAARDDGLGMEAIGVRRGGGGGRGCRSRRCGGGWRGSGCGSCRRGRLGRGSCGGRPMAAAARVLEPVRVQGRERPGPGPGVTSAAGGGTVGAGAGVGARGRNCGGSLCGYRSRRSRRNAHRRGNGSGRRGHRRNRCGPEPGPSAARAKGWAGVALAGAATVLPGTATGVAAFVAFCAWARVMKRSGDNERNQDKAHGMIGFGSRQKFSARHRFFLGRTLGNMKSNLRG